MKKSPNTRERCYSAMGIFLGEIDGSTSRCTGAMPN